MVNRVCQSNFNSGSRDLKVKRERSFATSGYRLKTAMPTPDGGLNHSKWIVLIKLAVFFPLLVNSWDHNIGLVLTSAKNSA
jgi:hypothetical protein